MVAVLVPVKRVTLVVAHAGPLAGLPFDAYFNLRATLPRVRAGTRITS